MERSTIVALAIAGFSAAYGSPCTYAAAYTYTSLDRPNKAGLVVTDTYAYGISGNTVVGTCFDAGGNATASVRRTASTPV